MDSTDEEDATAVTTNAVAETNGTGTGSRQTTLDTLPSSTRLMRNMAEKMRRDKLNMHISQLAAIVPIVSMATKRVDKTSILRLSAAYLRIYQNLLSERLEKTSWKPCFLEDDVLTSLLLEAVNGFLLIVSTTGKVIYVSDEIEKTLGHSPVDIIGHSVYNILHPDDGPVMRQNLMVTPENETERRSFYCHLSERCLSRSDCGKYDLVHILGHVRIAKPPSPTVTESGTGNNSNCNGGLGSAVREDLLICVVRQVRNQAISEISWMEGCQNEYMTQHTLDGNIISVDHRISIITGHLPEEVCGKSAYAYIFEKDIPSSVLAHREFFFCESGSSTVINRLWTRSRKLIYLKTIGKMQENSYSHSVDNFLCVNKLMTEEEGKRELVEFQRRYPTAAVSSDTKLGEDEVEEDKDSTSQLKDKSDDALGSELMSATPMTTLTSIIDFLHTSAVEGALIKTETGSDRTRQRSVSVSVSTTSTETRKKEDAEDEVASAAVLSAGNRRHSTNSLVSEGAATGGRGSWWQKNSTVMEAVCVTSTTPEPDVVEMREDGDGDGNVAIQTSPSTCTLTATARILEVNGKRKSGAAAATTSQLPPHPPPPASSRDLSGKRTSVVITTRQRRMTRHVVRLSSYHTPSPDDVEMLLEHGAQSHAAGGSTGNNNNNTNMSPSVVVPFKRRCSAKVSAAEATLTHKRGRGRPRQNSY